jgi:hypothetical protein
MTCDYAGCDTEARRTIKIRQGRKYSTATYTCDEHLAAWLDRIGGLVPLVAGYGELVVGDLRDGAQPPEESPAP